MNRDVKIGLAIGLLLLVGLFVWFAVRQSHPKPPVDDLTQREAENAGADRTVSDPGVPSANDFFVGDCGTNAGNGAQVTMGNPPGAAVTPGGTTGITPEGQRYLDMTRPGPVNPTPPTGVITPTPPTPPVAGTPTSYVVKRGDSLSTISRKVYGSVRFWEKIAQANNITDARTLRPNMTLRIPALSDAERASVSGHAVAPAGGAAIAPLAAAGGQTHKVVSGDTLEEISKRYYGTVRHAKTIMDANHIADARLLRVGTTLVIPKLEAASPVAPIAPVTPVMAPPAVVSIPTGNREYVVKQGDTIQMISKRFYGSVKHYLFLMQANNLDDPRSVRIGTKLVIPPNPEIGAASVVTPVTETVSMDPSVSIGEKRYTVRDGDTVAIIAATELGSSLYSEDVMKRNGLTEADNLRPGQVLVLPARSALRTLSAVSADE